MTRLLATLMLIAIAGGCAHTPSAPVTLGPELQAIQDYTYADSREALTVVEDLVRAAINTPGAAPNMSAQLAALLKPNTTLGCKDFVCRQLYLVGTDNAVPALARLLNDDVTADMARYALEAIPGKAATKALIAALDSAPRPAQVGIVNSLAARRDPASRSTLEGLAAGNDTLAEAARAGLAKLGD